MRETLSEAVVDYEDLVYPPSDVESGPWTHRDITDGFGDRIALRPKVAELRYTGWEPLSLPPVPPTHIEEPLKLKVVPSGTYSVNYGGYIQGNYSLAVDFGPAGDWLGVQTAVLFMCLDLAPGAVYQLDPDWTITVDINGIFQWAALVFSRAVGRVAGIPSSVYVKYVGQLLPTLGTVTLGFKIHGQRTDDTKQSDFNMSVGLNASLTSLYARGELVGTPNIGGPESDSDD